MEALTKAFSQFNLLIPSGIDEALLRVAGRIDKVGVAVADFRLKKRSVRSNYRPAQLLRLSSDIGVLRASHDELRKSMAPLSFQVHCSCFICLL